MSWKVVEEIVEHSRSKHGTRTVLLVIGETAHHDGVAFGMPQAPTPGREGHCESLMERANLGLRSIERAIAKAQELDELEIRTYRVGSHTFNAYRVVVGRLRSIDADHERLRTRYNLVLDPPFSSPAELLLSPADRPRSLPAKVAGRTEASDPPKSPDLPAKMAESDPHNLAGLTRARLTEDSSIEHGPNSSRTFSSSKNEEENVSAEDADASGFEERKKLIRVFAEELGRWPANRGEWATWHTAFKQLETHELTAEQLRHACRSFRRRWPHLALDSPFALQKTWLLLTASFEPSYFTLHRWVTDVSWRIGDEEETTWVLEHAPVSDTERGRLLALAADVAEAHTDEAGRFLRWVERDGWAVDDEEWLKRTAAARKSLGTLGPSTMRDAQERRLRLRATLGQLRFGVGEEEVA